MSVSPLIASLQDIPYFATLVQERGTDWLEQTFTLFEIDGEVTRHNLTASFAATLQDGALPGEPEIADPDIDFDEAALLGALQAADLAEDDVSAEPLQADFPYLSEIEDPDIDLDETALFDAMLDDEAVQADMQPETQAAETEAPADSVTLDVSLFEALDAAQAAVSEAIDQVSGQFEDTDVPDLLATGDNFLALDLHRDPERAG